MALAFSENHPEPEEDSEEDFKKEMENRKIKREGIE